MQLFARYWPLLTLITWIGLALASDGRQRWTDPDEVTPSLIAMLLILPPYLALIYYLLPALIYPEIPNNSGWQIGWFFFAGLTAGIGPVLLYWKKVDPWLSAWIKTREWKQGL